MANKQNKYLIFVGRNKMYVWATILTSFIWFEILRYNLYLSPKLSIDITYIKNGKVAFESIEDKSKKYPFIYTIYINKDNNIKLKLFE